MQGESSTERPGNGSFSNYVLAGLVLIVPLALIRYLPLFRFGFYTYIFFFLLSGVPTAIAVRSSQRIEI